MTRSNPARDDEDVIFSRGSPDDLPAVRRLLDRCALSSSDLHADQLDDFLTGRIDGEIAATAGLQRSGGSALFRSLAVAPDLRGRGIAHELWRRTLEHARAQGVQQLYLLTTTAAALFERWGFQRVRREAVPTAISTMPEFATLCPSSAVVMELSI